MTSTGRKRVLFVGEGATLAHVARPLVLSSALESDAFEATFACDPRYQWALRDFAGAYLPLWSQDSRSFLAALERGRPLYDEATLERYVRDDLELFQKASPEVVIGDFRLSLSVSARLAGIPYVSVSNCYWSPHWRPSSYTVPNLPLTRYLPLPLANALFRVARPAAFALHCRPLNKVRRKHGLVSLGSDLRRVYTDADHVLYADLPALFPETRLPATHHLIGPLIWSPPVPLPGWWHTLPRDRPIIYVTMGSSGQAALLPSILRSMEDLNAIVILATAGARIDGAIPANARMGDYLPGDAAARIARVVVCNGGSPTTQQALVAGVPVIGIASNLDQFLNMYTIERAGAGITLRADRINGATLRGAIETLLERDSYTTAARQVGQAQVSGAVCAPARYLNGLLREILSNDNSAAKG